MFEALAVNLCFPVCRLAETNQERMEGIIIFNQILL